MCDNSVGERESQVTEDYKTKYPHEAFIQICNKLGWKYNTYATKAISDKINISGETYNYFINHFLVNNAESINGDTDYVFWMVDNSGFRYGQYVKDVDAFFLPQSRIRGGNVVAEYQAGVVYSQDLISFKTSYKGSQLLGVGTDVELRGMAEDTKLPVIFKKTLNARGIGEQESMVNEHNLRAVRIMPRSTDTMSNAEIKTYASWIKGQRAVYTAEMEAKGNTRLRVGSSIYMLVMTPAGNPHHSTGKYLITSVTENINSNGYTTACQLTKLKDEEVVRDSKDKSKSTGTGGGARSR